MTTTCPEPTTPTTTRSFSSSVYVVNDGLISILQDSFNKPNDWAHSVLTQGFHVPRDLALKVLRKETAWAVLDNQLKVIECLESSSSPPSQS